MPGLAGISAALVDPRRADASKPNIEKVRGLASAEPLRQGITESVLGRACLGDEIWIGHGAPPGAERPQSFLLVVLITLEVFILVIIVAVVVGVSRRAMGLVNLIVPQLAIGAVPGEQLGMGAALDRLAT